MTDDKDQTTEPAQSTDNTKDGDKKLQVQNPFNKNNNKEITQQDVESEQEFKEAQTERD